MDNMYSSIIINYYIITLPDIFIFSNIISYIPLVKFLEYVKIGLLLLMFLDFSYLAKFLHLIIGDGWLEICACLFFVSILFFLFFCFSSQCFIKNNINSMNSWKKSASFLFLKLISNWNKSNYILIPIR